MSTCVFLDESGDLSFDFRKPGISRHFLITVLIVPDPRPIERSVKKVIRWIRHRHPKHCGCLHAYHEDAATRRKLLSLIADTACQIMVIELNKQKVYTKLRDEKAVLYNYVANILLDRLISGGFLAKNRAVHLIAARRETNKFLNVNFRNYLRDQVKANHGMHLEVTILSPDQHKGLQAADMLSWAAFRSVEHGDDSYLHLMRGKVQRSTLFP